MYQRIKSTDGHEGQKKADSSYYVCNHNGTTHGAEYSRRIKEPAETLHSSEHVIEKEQAI